MGQLRLQLLGERGDDRVAARVVGKPVEHGGKHRKALAGASRRLDQPRASVLGPLMQCGCHLLLGSTAGRGAVCDLSERARVDPSIRTTQITAHVQRATASVAGNGPTGPVPSQPSLDNGCDVAMPVQPLPVGRHSVSREFTQQPPAGRVGHD